MSEYDTGRAVCHMCGCRWAGNHHYANDTIPSPDGGTTIACYCCASHCYFGGDSAPTHCQKPECAVGSVVEAFTR